MLSTHAIQTPWPLVLNAGRMRSPVLSFSSRAKNGRTLVVVMGSPVGYPRTHPGEGILRAAILAHAASTAATTTATAAGGVLFRFGEGRGLDARFGLTDTAYPSIITASCALDVFLAPAVALSPALFYSNYHGNYTNFRRFGLSVTFGLYI